MSKAVRQTVTLTKPQAAYLKREAKRLGVTVSELIRRIVDEFRYEGEGRRQVREGK